MEEVTTPFRRNRPLQLMIAWLLMVWAVTAIKPLYPIDWVLENLLTYIYGALLIITHRRFKFSNTSYGLFTVFLTLHMIGAHYTYAETPLGFWMQEWFGFSRNHYDRLVHFSYGLLLVVPMREAVVRIIGVPLRWSRFMAVIMILSFSAFYELLEMWTAMIVSPELGDAYLGTQGDVWDAQRDTFLAFAGAIVTMILGARRKKAESA
jgi:putative membrane protein